MPNTATKLEVMTCKDFFESYCDEWFCSYADNAYWEDSFSTDRFFAAMLEKATAEGFVLSDADTWDYDEYLYTAYQYTEKGLS